MSIIKHLSATFKLTSNITRNQCFTVTTLLHATTNSQTKYLPRFRHQIFNAQLLPSNKPIKRVSKKKNIEFAGRLLPPGPPSQLAPYIVERWPICYNLTHLNKVFWPRVNSCNCLHAIKYTYQHQHFYKLLVVLVWMPVC